MQPSRQELDALMEGAGCARFVHTNLHLHTPATPWDWDSQPGQTRKAKSLSPETYYEAVANTSLDLVAITDHNCVEWCQPLLELAAAGRSTGASRLHVLPGVEISTYEGPHVVGLFDETQDIGAIRNMLIRLGMSGKGLAEDRVTKSSGHIPTASDVIEKIAELGGIAVGPHVHSKDGLWGAKDFK